MKAELFIVLLSIFPLIVWAQTPNYEQQGDELYQQAQYEKAIKKYNAATELNAAGSQVSQKIQNAQTCISLTNSAISAENANAYSKAIDVYTRLYELNSIVLYKEKIAGLKQKIKDVEQARIRREAEERDRAISKADGYVDLGLPSGTLWKTENEDCGLVTYDKAYELYGNSLPTYEQLKELND